MNTDSYKPNSSEGDIRYTSSKKNRYVHIDFIRIIAIFFVIFSHTTGVDFIQKFSTETGRCGFFLIYYLSSSAVPLFYMLSGALLLGKEETLWQVFQKRVLKYGIVLLLISFAYFLSDVSKGWAVLSLRDFTFAVYSSVMAPQLWYLYSYIGLMTMLPLLRRMAQGMRGYEFLFFAGASMLFQDIIPLFESMLGTPSMYSSLRGALFTSNKFVLFFMGYYIEHIMPKKLLNKKAASLSVMLILLCGSFTYCITKYKAGIGAAYSEVYQSTFVCVVSYAIYFFLKYFFENTKRIEIVDNLITVLGSLTFGVYLLEHFLRKGAAPLYTVLEPVLGPMPACLLWVLAAMSAGYAVAYVLKKIPGIRTFL